MVQLAVCYAFFSVLPLTRIEGHYEVHLGIE